MRKVVVDASVSIKWVLREDLRAEALGLLREWIANDGEFIVPFLWEHEVDSAFRRKERLKEITPDDTESAWEFLMEVNIVRLHRPDARRRAYEIARRASQHAVYDSVYAALAELEACEMWTADETYFNAVRGFLPHVRFLGDYSPSQTEFRL